MASFVELQPNVHHFQVSGAGVTLAADLHRRNGDVLIEVYGGDVPHYGVVTMVDTAGTIQSVALPSRPGRVHQETVLTELVARTLRPVLQGTAIITGGVHVNIIQPEQMHAIFPLTEQLAVSIRDYLAAHPATVVEEIFASPAN